MMLARIQFRGGAGAVLREELLMLAGGTVESAKTECARLFANLPPRLETPGTLYWDVELQTGESFIVPEVSI